MKHLVWSRWGVSLVMLISFFPATVRADQQADDLYAQYKAAMAKNQVEQAVEFLCGAAKLDTQKYGKSCDSAQQYVASRLQKYDGLFVTGKSEFASKDYVGAIRDLSKIDFGPKREEAQKLIGQANDLINHPQPVDTSPQSLKAAQVAYDNGDFATAGANAGLVKAADLQPQSQAILSNIKSYNDNVQQGDALMAGKNYAAAQQKYNAALSIKSNGPGNLLGKLQQIAGLMSATKATATTAANNKSGTPSPVENTAKIKTDLAAAQDAAAKGNWQAALAEYDQALTLDPKQQEAITGKVQAQDAIKAALSKDPKALEDTLIGGIRSYYESHFLEARDALTLYLTAGGTRSKGAAYFYLGAAMLAQAFVSDPKSKDDQDRLQQSALQQFQQAKQVRYRPAEKYISPKILAIWNQPGM